MKVLNATTTSFDSRVAIATVKDVLAGTPYAEDELILLRPPADNAVVALPASGVVARVGAGVAHRTRLGRELELASWLSARGMDVTRPASSPPTPQLFEIDGRVITWWAYLPTTERAGYRAIGGLLARLHRQRPPWPGLLTWDPWSRVPAQLDAARGGIPRSDCEQLEECWRRLRRRWVASRWPAEPQVVVHGDIHQGNTLVYGGRAHLLDFEDACLGPRQWDIASVVGSWRLGWVSDLEFAQFTATYGDDFRNDRDFDVLVDISLFRRTCWYASRAGREPHVVEAVRHRIATLADPSLPRRWQRG